MSFFTELKRRNVIRFAGLYLVGAWLLVQVAGTVLPMFGAPDWLPRSIVILLAIAFVPALIFSWVFEMTPQGLKRDEDVPPEESIAPRTARRMNRMIIAVLVIALGYFVFDKFVLTPRRNAALVAATKKSFAAQPSMEPKSAASAKSVAVLAFANLSDDKGSEYFSDGISEELLTVLQKIPGLHVAARTSAFSFKGKNATAQEIGQKLGVAHLVDGSVRKAGDAVRIAPRLTSGIATMPPRGARKASTLIWPPRARRWNEPSRSNQICPMRSSRGQRSKQISIIIGKLRPKHCARPLL